MNLKEVFDQFAYGELSQLSIGGQPAGVINEQNYERLLIHVNPGLTDLYKRFLLKKSELKLDLVPLQTLYRLHSDYSVHNQRLASVTKYILDEAKARFKNDILKIEQVFTDDGVELALNDGANRYSLDTPSLTALRVPEDIVNQVSGLPDCYKTVQLRVVYRADHPRIVSQMGFLDPTRIELELPPSHLLALCFFVASRVNNPVGMANEFHAGNSYYAKYLSECADLERQSLEIEEIPSNDRLYRGGWV